MGRGSDRVPDKEVGAVLRRMASGHRGRSPPEEEEAGQKAETAEKQEFDPKTTEHLER